MTAVAIGGTFMLPSVSIWASADTAITLDAAGSPTTGVAGDYVAFVIRVPETGTIDAVTVRLGTTSATGGNGTLSCQLFNLDAAGDPNGSSAYGSCTKVDYAVTGTDDNTFHKFTGLACTATRGEYVAVTIWLSALVTTCSVGILNSGSFASGAFPASNFPYTTSRTTGTGAGSHSNVGFGVTVAYSGGATYDIGVGPASNAATESLDADGTLRRAGNIFILPAPVTVHGAWVVMDNDTDTTTIKLYDTDGTTVLASATQITANRATTSGGWNFFAFTGAAVNLSANTSTGYRLVAETNNTSATAVTTRKMTVNEAADWGQMTLGSAWYYTSHNGTSWTDTATARAAIGLMVSKIDDGAGGGGGSVALPPIRQH